MRSIILLLCFGVPVAGAQTIQSPYNASYTLSDLGSVPGLPAPYGGLAFLPSNPNVVVIGGAANSAEGARYSIGVIRGAQNHIAGFTGTAALYSEGQFNDGGVVFGPGGVLFYTRHPVNQIGQVKPGSAVNDKVIDLGPLGVASSVGALNFVPAGFPGAGQMKIVSYDAGTWYTAAFSPDGTGTFNITSATLNTTISGGPEGFIYVPIGSPIFPSGTSMLVSEYDTGVVSTYQIEANGNPVPASRAVFISGLTGAEGAVIDPVTGDFLFSTFEGGNRVIVVRALAPAIETRILPVVGSTPGAGGTFFKTSVQLHNSASSGISGRIVFHPSGAAGSGSDPTLFYSLAQGQTQSFADLLPAIGQSGLGSADILVTSGSAPVATVRVFNDAGPSGTTGFTEELMRPEEALRTGQQGVLLVPADLVAYRLNIGVRTLETGGSMTLTVRDAGGAVVTTVPLGFPATYHEQQPAGVFLNGVSLPAGGSVTVLVGSGSAIVYGATVDNRTGDPSLQIARAAP